MANIINGTDTGSGGLITSGDNSDELQLQTAETARVTLTNTAVVVNEGGNDVDFRVEGDTDANLLFVDAGNDRIGVGTNTPSGKFSVVGDGYFTSNSIYDLRFIGVGGDTPTIRSVYNVNSNLRPLGIEGSDIVFKTDTASATSGTERVRILSSGGITFNGDTAAANALDDYEEGTWTPTAPVGLSASTATYQKIGNTVLINAFININSNSDGATFLLSGLPYAIASGNSSSVGCFNNDSSVLYAYLDTSYLSIRDNTNTSKTCANLSSNFVAFQLSYIAA